jgi:hypothetical protein
MHFRSFTNILASYIVWVKISELFQFVTIIAYKDRVAMQLLTHPTVVYTEHFTNQRM